MSQEPQSPENENSLCCFILIYTHFQTLKLFTTDINAQSSEQQETGNPAQSFCTTLMSQQQQTGLMGSSREIVHIIIFIMYLIVTTSHFPYKIHTVS